MTGPRIPAVHPHRRRGRLLLFLAVVLTPLACTSDPALGPAAPETVPSAAATRLHPYRMNQNAAAMSMSSGQRAASLVVASATSSTGPKVLILSDYDGPSTNALAATIADAGYQVAIRPAPEYTWDGTDPSLEGFATVIHLNGATFDVALPEAAQHALTSFVQNGGGFIGAQWNGYEQMHGAQNQMPDLVLQEYGGTEHNCAYCLVTFSTVGGQESHPVLADVPSSFTYRADAHETGLAFDFASSPSTVLMQVGTFPAVLVREFGSGKVVSFSFAPNYENFDFGASVPFDRATLVDPNVQRLYLNAVRWTAGAPGAALQPQTITFGPLADRTFGDPVFTVGATASSSLPVNFTATGGCTIAGAAVTITAAGSCTITAHQSGNETFEPAGNVAQLFTINQATPVVHWAAPASISAGTALGATQLNATATGVGGVSLGGGFVYLPAQGTVLAAGVHPLSVEFFPTSGNYTGAIKTVSITVTEGTWLNFSGFYRPVRNLPTRNRVKAGRAVILKFSLGGNRGMGVLQPGAPTSRSVACERVPSERTLEGLRTSSKSGLFYNRHSRRYYYLWKTDPSWAGTCRMFVLTLVDGTTHEALFHFPKKQRGRDHDDDDDDDDDRDRGGNRERDRDD